MESAADASSTEGDAVGEAWARRKFDVKNGVSVGMSGSQSVHTRAWWLHFSACTQCCTDILQHAYDHQNLIMKLYAPLNKVCWTDWLPTKGIFPTKFRSQDAASFKGLVVGAAVVAGSGSAVGARVSLAMSGLADGLVIVSTCTVAAKPACASAALMSSLDAAFVIKAASDEPRLRVTVTSVAIEGCSAETALSGTPRLAARPVVTAATPSFSLMSMSGGDFTDATYVVAARLKARCSARTLSFSFSFSLSCSPRRLLATFKLRSTPGATCASRANRTLPIVRWSGTETERLNVCVTTKSAASIVLDVLRASAFITSAYCERLSFPLNTWRTTVAAGGMLGGRVGLMLVCFAGEAVGAPVRIVGGSVVVRVVGVCVGTSVGEADKSVGAMVGASDLGLPVTVGEVGALVEELLVGVLVGLVVACRRRRMWLTW